MAETLLLRGIPGTAWLSLWYTLYRRGGHWPTAFLVLYQQLLSLPEGGKFLLSAVYASCFGNYFSAHFAVPHPSRLRRATFPPGEGLRRAAAGNGGMSREKGLYQRKQIATPVCGLVRNDGGNLAIAAETIPSKARQLRSPAHWRTHCQRPLAADTERAQGRNEHRRTGARIGRPPCGQRNNPQRSSLNHCDSLRVIPFRRWVPSFT